MAGTILENLSGRKLAYLSIVLSAFLLACFILGGFGAPAPTRSQTISGTICLDKENDRSKWFSVWSLGNEKPCDRVANLDELRGKDLFDGDEAKDLTDLKSENVVFAFQMPLRKDKTNLDYTRWQQNLIGLLLFDIEHDPEYTLASNATLTLDARLAYRNKHDTRWHLLASSIEERHLDCKLEIRKDDDDQPVVNEKKEPIYEYECQVIPLFELGSLHHDYYLLNLRMDTSYGQNMDIGKPSDLHLVTLFQNGGFTKVWVSIKTIFLPLVVGLTIWFWRRVRLLPRPPNLLEYMLMILSASLTLLNMPLEFLTLRFDLPFALLLTDIRQGVFYSVLLSFWLIFCGEHLMDDVDRNKIRSYWKQLTVVACGCLSLFIFDMCERGVQLTNPFYSIWATPVGTNLALGFIILAGISAGLYFIFLSYNVWQVFKNISTKQSSFPTLSSVRRMNYEGIIYRFKFLMLATLICAAMTVIGFILGQIAEGQWKWEQVEQDLYIEYTSAVFTGIYGMWNVYTMTVICLYAPSHKRWPTTCSTIEVNSSAAEEIEFQRLSPTEPSEIAALTAFAKKTAQE